LQVFPFNHEFWRDECPIVYSGKIIARSTEDAGDEYGRFLFAVNMIYPSGVSGSPVVLDVKNKKMILLGSYSGYNSEKKMSLVTNSTWISDVLNRGIELHKRKWRST